MTGASVQAGIALTTAAQLGLDRQPMPSPSGTSRSERMPDPYPCESCLSHAGGVMDDRAWVDLVVPVYNEEAVLADSVHRLHAYLSEEFPFDWRIVIADNASTDHTRAVAHRLAEELAGVEVVEITEKGRGRALRGSVDDLERRHRRLHGRRSVDGVDRAAAVGRAAGLGPLRRVRRLSPESRFDGRTRTKARAHLADLQPAAPSRLRRPLPRRAVWIQGGAYRHRQAARASRSRRGVVLRHGVAASRRAQRAARPRGRLSTGSTIPTAASTSRRRR